MKLLLNSRLTAAVLLLAGGGAAETITVCAAGCASRTVQAAVDRARAGDVVELKAGERFTESVTIGPGKSRITLRSSRFKELPADGYRIRPVEDAALLATIASPATEAALRIGGEQNSVLQNGVDLATGRLRFDYATPYATLRNGAAVACYGREEFLARLPAPLVQGQRYWVRDWDPAARTGRLAESAGGPAIRLTDAGSAGQGFFYSRPACTLWDQPSEISVMGIRFEASRSKVTRNLVQVGHNAEADPVKMGPSQIVFEHTVITGAQDDPNGPMICLALFGGHQLRIADSWIGHCKTYGEESKGIGIQNVIGAKITNNYISAASINLLTGGSDAARGEVNQNLEITGNFFEKPGYMMYKEGPAEPTGNCYYGGGSGAVYHRTGVTPNTCANGACYTCTANHIWEKTPQAPYRNNHYLTKNLVELKDCEHCLVQGNMMRGSYAGPDGGQGWCFGVSTGVSKPGMSGFGGAYHRAHDVVFRDNHADACYSGIVAGNSAYQATFNQVPIRGLTVENNLLTNFGLFPELSQFPAPETVYRYGLKQSGGNQDVRIANNTVRGRPNGAYAGVMFYSGSHQPNSMVNYQLVNNIFQYQQYSLILNSRSNDCSPVGLFSLVPQQRVKRLANNIFYGGQLSTSFLDGPDCQSTLAGKLFTVADEQAVGFVSETDSRLKASSPFSASNKKPRGLSEDGADLGADVDLVEQYSIPALKGIPPAPAQINLEVVPAARQVVLRYQRPEGVTGCQVAFYSGARIDKDLIEDTASAASQQDTRASSMVKGRQVQFVAGASKPLLPGRAYTYRIQCGALQVIGRLRTLEGTPAQ